MAFVIGRLALSGCGEGLAWATACPNRSVVGPSGKSERVRPSANTGEEMGLLIALKVVSLGFND
jgi:hypothetical protein